MKFPLLTVSLWLAAQLGSLAQGEKPQPTHADVRYGPYDRNVLDVYLAKADKPTPVLVYYHGGGWVGGDKRPFDAGRLLQQGISVIAVNYRFTRGTKDAAPYPAPMADSARALQFVRSKAQEWNLDPNRVALTGGSAGAVISMWIAYRDDMAKPESADPVERFSTRVTCLVPMAGPTTLDPKEILQRVGGNPAVHPAMLPFYGVRTLEELQTPEKQKVIADASPINHVTADDPPTYLMYAYPKGGAPLPPETPFNTSIHHSEFGVLLKEKLDAVKVENVLQTKGDGSEPGAMAKFLAKHLKPGQ